MQAINYAMTLPVDEPGPRLLLIVVAHHVNWQTGTMYVSQDVLAKEVRASKRSVQRWLLQLEEGDYISRSKQRGADGHQGVDAIELLGYLEWQNVINNGGTLPNPETRGKPIKSQGDKLATGQIPGRQTEASRATNQVVQGDTRVAHNRNPYLTIDNLSADVRASEGARTPAPKKHLPQFVITPADSSWGHWVAWLTDNDRRDLVLAAQEARQMVTASRWPSDNSPLPSVDGRPALEKRKRGEAA
jgi:hypothetical protein